MDDAQGWAGAWLFLTPREARTAEAAMARLFPSDELGPGAVEAGAVVYLDRALAGAERDLQPRYRRGLAGLDGMARARCDRPFAECTADEQDRLLADLEADTAPEFGEPGAAPRFFELLRAHTLEGLFCDPAHGGNRGLVGWALLGYPGPRPGYRAEEQALDAQILDPRRFTAADYPLRPEDAWP
jgi:gluconate 2-dehydrogenase gamma chain